MNILELDSYRLGDAVKFNDKLNPKLWGSDEHLHPQIREQLLRIAEDFAEFLGVSNFEIKDITISGSNAAYTYTANSDIDLHLVVDLPKADTSEVYRELFDAKKYQYNDQHNITIGGYDVELYVQNANQPHISQGIYSVLNNDWVSVPKRAQPTVDDISTRSKYETLSQQIDQAIESKDYEMITALVNKIKKMRQAGLEQHGEFGPENIAFKMLRSQGAIERLYAARNAAKDELLSLDERRRKKKGGRKKSWGYFGGYWYPGTGYAGQDTPAAQAAGDGGGDGGAESIREDAGQTDEQILRDFIKFCVAELKIKQMPVVKLRKDPEWPKRHKTFGRYSDDDQQLEVAWGNRHIMDVLRTVAHELTHKRQHERENVPPGAGETGSEYENEANARAGVLMRDWARLHPEHFEAGQANDLEESASGYIPTKKQAKDPRFSMALTVDIKPGQVGKEANKLKLKTDRQGHPQIARANGLVEALALEFVQFKKAKEDYSPDAPPGPEFKPTMPAGTLRVDVSDMYDWYKLGQHISNMKGLGKHDFGAGPPSSIISFGDEDTEHKFIGDIKATGLDVTDIDPVDPKKRPGKTIKTDPTYNVNEFAPGPARDDNDDVPDQLVVLANRWWNATDKQPQIEHVLNSLGWSIHQVESEDDAVQLQHRDGTTYFISADDFDPDLFESADLDEVKMSPSALEKFVTSKEAQGIRAGFEAELIFRDTQGESDEMDPEPDYDADERAYSISQVIEFFDNDEYGYGLSDRQRNRLEEQLDETYMLWRDEQMTSDFRNEAEELVREQWLEERPMGERVLAYLTDALDMTDEEAERILRLGTDAPRFNSTSEQEGYAAENPDYETYLEAVEAAEAILDEDVETSIAKQDGYYDQALDDFRDNWSGDDDSFFSDVDLRWMSDIANEFNLDWPVWNMSNGGNGGSRDWDEIGAELQQVVGMPVKVSSNYHSTPRKEGQWIIEPDGSLDPDDKSDEAGLEIVSPPMPLLMAIAKLKEVTDWANDPQGGNAYTNRSTGLHMGVSLPVRGGDVDYVKLILFMGDKYVLDAFGREANSFTASALGKLRQNIKGGKSDPAGVVELLRHGLTELAFKELQKGVGTSKYTSAHLQNGYIEFRSPGGDWLAKADEEIGILENTMMRFARAMQIAGDPGADRQEYAKKLYKLVTTDNEQYTDQLRLFSEFSAGTIDKEQLKKQWAEKTIGTERKTNQRWKLYDRATGEPVPGQEYNGYTEEEARAKAKGKISPGSSDRDFDSAYELRNIGQEQQWEVYAVDTGKTLEIVQGRNKGEAADAVFDKYAAQKIGFNVRPYQDPATMTPRTKLAKRITTKKIDYNYDIIDRRTVDLKVVDRFYATDDKDASETFDRWLNSKGLPSDEDAYGYRKGRQAADDQRDSVDLQRRLGVQDVDTDVAQNFGPRRQNYELVSDEEPDRVLHRMNNATADEVRAWITQQEQGGMPAGFLRTRIVAESLRSSIAQAIIKVEENFADGKVKGKSRPGRVKRSGASCAGSVTDLRARAKNASGEKAKMYHWCANMKSGRKK
jgi:hypothetical protein